MKYYDYETRQAEATIQFTAKHHNCTQHASDLAVGEWKCLWYLRGHIKMVRWNQNENEYFMRKKDELVGDHQ